MTGQDDCSGPRKVRAVKTEIYSRVVGYYRPVQDWNKGKQEEFSEREYVDLAESAGEGGNA